MMKNNILYIAICLTFGCTFASSLFGQGRIVLNLQKTIDLANDSSLEAFRIRNLYLSGYWEYRTYKANRLPSLTLNATPAEYNKDITQRYDSENDVDVYRSQQSYYAYGNLSVKQNLDWTGGTFYLNSNLSYIRSFGATDATQFTSVPLRIGYSQSLLGYNAFKWDKRIEPLKYEKVKKQLIYNMEAVSEKATTYFFALAMADAKYKLAQDNVVSSDTLYRMGVQRHKIAAISQADLLTLKLDLVNARNTLQNTIISRKRAMFALASFLDMDKNTEIQLDLPGHPQEILIIVDKALNLAKENNPDFLDWKQNVLEAQQALDKAKKESGFNASLDASIGYNQVANNFSDAYHRPMQQELVSVSFSIPLLDWGVSKGKRNMAQNNLEVVKTSSRQSEVTLEEEVIMTVNDFNIQQSLIASAEEALDLSILAYNETRQRFMIGKTDINSLTLSLNRQQEAQQNYISALQDYWLNYYKIRKLTLHDFASDFSLSEKFDYKLNSRW
nr:TolC family protein [Bacteroides ihuae]